MEIANSVHKILVTFKQLSEVWLVRSLRKSSVRSVGLSFWDVWFKAITVLEDRLCGFPCVYAIARCKHELNLLVISFGWQLASVEVQGGVRCNPSNHSTTDFGSSHILKNTSQACFRECTVVWNTTMSDRRRQDSIFGY